MHQPRALISFALLVLALLGPSVGFAAEARFHTDAETIAIGDLHGNFEALLKILSETELIDENLNWVGGDRHLVVAGDLFAGAPDSRLIVDLLMKLESQAPAQVHTLLGNHDLLVASGNFDHIDEEEARKYTKYAIDGRHFSTMEEAIKSTKYGQWLASLNQIVVINNEIYMHAGADRKRLETLDIDTVNESTHRFIAGWIMQPLSSLNWIVGIQKPKFDDESGPSWFRGFKGSKEEVKASLPRNTLRDFLKRVGVSRMVVGHSPTPDSEPVLNHPYYGRMLAMIDTRISDPANGKITAVRFSAEGRAKALKFTLDARSKAARKNVLKRMKKAMRCGLLFSNS